MEQLTCLENRCACGHYGADGTGTVFFRSISWCGESFLLGQADLFSFGVIICAFLLEEERHLFVSAMNYRKN
jgi:hypothetical protein